MSDLTDAEAQELGPVVTHLSRALTAREGAEHIYVRGAACLFGE